MAENIREIIVDTLLMMEREKVFSHYAVRAVLEKYDYLDPKEKAFFKRITEGTIERRIELEYYLNQYSKVPVVKMKPFIRCLMLMSVYQLLFMDAVPDSAVCNEAVKLAGKRHFQNLKGYVNGVLRAIAKAKEDLILPDKEKNPVAYLSVKYSMPEWIVDMWLEEYPVSKVEKILEGLLEIHPVSLRFSTLLSENEREQLCGEIEDKGGKLTPSNYLPYVFLIEDGDDVAKLPGFAEGKYVVQDVSSALTVEMAGIAPTDFCVDVCAAPGGKTLLAAEKAKQVLSRDVSEDKVQYIEENLLRMGLQNVTTQIYDGRQSDEGLYRKADVVLLDVPCSGLGILGKKRDIKYHLSPEGLESLTELQREIIRASVEYVKPGGTLMYSTCTIRKQENIDMARWIAREFDLEPVSIRDQLPEELHPLLVDEQGAFLQLLPGFSQSDGFFMAKFRRPDGNE